MEPAPVLRALHAFVGKITISICIDERTFVEKINFGNCLEEIRVVSCWLCRHLLENNCSSIICFTLEHPRWCFAFLIWNIYLNVKCTLSSFFCSINFEPLAIAQYHLFVGIINSKYPVFNSLKSISRHFNASITKFNYSSFCFEAVIVIVFYRRARS